MNYVSAKDRSYNVVPTFATEKITHNSWVEKKENASSALYTSSNMVARERYHSAVLGKLHLKQSDDPQVESTTFTIRKENRAYMAETPIMSSFKMGKKDVTSNFAFGHHKDHKIMAGITFRMPF
ncbi:MAG: hypothetical protein MK052_05590 [Alphaproteobacteria bacterium]|nr:hypothetical protein [Alphaproteobacteria bacterium]